MKLNGVPTSGKRIALIDGVTVQLPSGAVYGKNQDGDVFCGKLKNNPNDYGVAAFSVADDSEFRWKFTIQSGMGTLTYDGPANGFVHDMSISLKNAAQNLSENMPFGSLLGNAEVHSGAEEDGVFVNCVCGENAFIPGRYMPGVFLLGLGTNPEVNIYYGTFDGVDVPVFEKEMLPVLNTARAEKTASQAPQPPKKIPVLDFSGATCMEVGPFSVEIPKGMHATDAISPQTRLLTCIPESDSFDDRGDSVIEITIQSGLNANGLRFPDSFLTAEGEKAAKEILSGINSPNIPSPTGWKKLLSAKNFYTAFQKISQDQWGVIYMYMMLTSEKCIYSGQYRGFIGSDAKADEKTHENNLRSWVNGITYRSEKQSAARKTEQTRALGKYAAKNGRIDAIKVSQLFSSDVAFNNEDEIKYDRKHHSMVGLQFNAEKIDSYPEIRGQLEAFGTEIRSVASFVEKNEALMLPNGRFHENLLAVTWKRPITGISLFNFCAWHMINISEMGKNDYRALVDRNLLCGIPHCYSFICEFIRTLRAYNEITEAFTVTVMPVANLDAPIDSIEEPIAGADKIESVKVVKVNGNAVTASARSSANANKSVSNNNAVKKQKAQQEEAAAKKQTEEERQKAEQEKELSQLQAQVKTLEQTKAKKEEKLRSLGIFKGAEKKALRKEIESLQNDIATARNKAEKLRILVTAEPVEYNDGPMSDEMKTLVRQLSWELGSGPKTAFELGLTSLHAANAVKHIENVYRVRVTRERTNAKGERKIVEETAYFIK